MILHTLKQKWNLFSRNVLPLPNPKKTQSMSIMQIDSFAASVLTFTEAYGVDVKLVRFNRLEGIFEYDAKQKNSFGPFHEREWSVFCELILFLKYIYNIDTKNEFVKTFVRFGSQLRFERLWTVTTNEWIYKHFKEIKQTHDLIYKFYKKIGLGNDYSHCVEYWEQHPREEILYK